MVAPTDCDKYCVQRILAFYRRHSPVDLADYFLAAWKYRHREQLGRAGVDLDKFATEAGLSVGYLNRVWKHLSDEDAVGPLAVVRTVWRDLPGPDQADKAQAGCQRLRDLV